MSASNEFEQSVLIELLELAVNNEELLKKHCDKVNNKGVFVFEITRLNGWNDKFLKTKTTYGFLDENLHYPGSDLVRFLQRKYGIEDVSSFHENYYPTNLRINFKDLPPLCVNYKSEQKELDPVETVYKAKYKWYKKPLSITATKRVTEYTPSYEITQGSIKAKISQRRYENLIDELNKNIDATKRKADLDKAMARVHELKGTNRK